MKPFDEQMLYEVPLTTDSVVIDVGTHDGNHVGILSHKFGCRFHGYEPVPEFYNKAVQRFAGNPRVTLWPFGLSDRDYLATFGVKGSLSGEYCAVPNESIEVPMRDVASVVTSLNHESFGLLDLNAEGAEFVILERLLNRGLIGRFNRVHVQPHPVVPDYDKRWERICERMAETHDMVFNAPWCWVGWELR